MSNQIENVHGVRDSMATSVATLDRELPERRGMARAAAVIGLAVENSIMRKIRNAPNDNVLRGRIEVAVQSSDSVTAVAELWAAEMEHALQAIADLGSQWHRESLQMEGKRDATREHIKSLDVALDPGAR